MKTNLEDSIYCFRGSRIGSKWDQFFKLMDNGNFFDFYYSALNVKSKIKSSSKISQIKRYVRSDACNGRTDFTSWYEFSRFHRIEKTREHGKRGETEKGRMTKKLIETQPRLDASHHNYRVSDPTLPISPALLHLWSFHPSFLVNPRVVVPTSGLIRLCWTIGRGIHALMERMLITSDLPNYPFHHIEQ